MNTTDKPKLTHIWWLHPTWPFAGVCGITMAMALLQSEANYLHYKTPKYLTAEHAWITLATIAFFAIGAILADKTGRVPRRSTASDTTVLRWFYLSLLLTMLGYAVWFAVGVSNGFSMSLVMQLLFTDDSGIGDHIRKDLFPSIPGVTTCTQFGVAGVMMGTWLFLRGHRHVLWPLCLIAMAGFARALLFNERTAVLELFLPPTLVLLQVRFIGTSLPAWVRNGIKIAPVAGPIALLLFFGSFEYFRSWRHYKDEFSSYGQFVVWRLSGYFTTAHNNGAMALVTDQDRPLPYATLLPIWEFPGVAESPWGYQKLTGISPEDAHLKMLENYGNIELNNNGGLFQPMLDFGFTGSLVFWCIYGFLAARLYRSFRAGTFAGLTIYPLVYLSILEVPLVLILFFPRLTPSLATLALVVGLLRQHGDSIPSHEPHPDVTDQ